MGKDRVKQRRGPQGASAAAAAAGGAGGSAVASVGFGGFVGSQRVGAASEAPGGAGGDAGSDTGGAGGLDARLVGGEVDPECAAALRRLTKRDETTKLKALAALVARAEGGEGTATVDAAALLPAWTYAYNRLALDASKKVRAAAARALGVLVRGAGRGLAPHMRPLVGAWWLARFDPFAECAAAADAAWRTALSDEKRRLAGAVAHRAAVVDAMAAYLAHTAATLSDMRSASPEEAVDRLARAHAAALAALGDLAAAAAAARVEDAGLGDKVRTAAGDALVRVADALVGGKAERTTLAAMLASKQASVRRAAYALVLKLCGVMGDANEAEAGGSGVDALVDLVRPERSAKAIFGALGDTEPTAQSELWAMLLMYMKRFPAAWGALDARKAVLPRLRRSVLSAAGDATGLACAAIAPCLLPLLALTPPEVAANVGLADALVEVAMDAALQARGAKQRLALLKGAGEVAAYCAAHAETKFASSAAEADTLTQDVLIDRFTSGCMALLGEGEGSRAPGGARPAAQAIAHALCSLAASRASRAAAALAAAAQAVVAGIATVPAEALATLVQAISDVGADGTGEGGAGPGSRGAVGTWAAEHLGRPLVAALAARRQHWLEESGDAGATEGGLVSALVKAWAMLPAAEREASAERAGASGDLDFVAIAATEPGFLSDGAYAASLVALSSVHDHESGDPGSEELAHRAAKCAARVLARGAAGRVSSDELVEAYEGLICAFTRACWGDADLLESLGVREGNATAPAPAGAQASAIQRVGAELHGALLAARGDAGDDRVLSPIDIADRAWIAATIACTDAPSRRLLAAAVLGEGAGSMGEAALVCARHLVGLLGADTLLWCEHGNGLWLAAQLLVSGNEACMETVLVDVRVGEDATPDLVARLSSRLILQTSTHARPDDVTCGLRALLHAAAQAPGWDADAAISVLEHVLDHEEVLGAETVGTLVVPLAGVIRRPVSRASDVRGDSDDEVDFGGLEELTARWCGAAVEAVRRHGLAAEHSAAALRLACAPVPDERADGRVGDIERDALAELAAAMRKARAADAAAASAEDAGGEDSSSDDYSGDRSSGSSGEAAVAQAWHIACTHAWHRLGESEQSEAMRQCEAWLKPAGVAVEEEAAGARMDATSVGWREPFDACAVAAARTAAAVYKHAGADAITEEVWAALLRLVVGAGSAEAAAEEGEGGGAAAAQIVCSARHRAGDAALWQAVAEVAANAPNDAVEDACEIAELVASADEGVEMAPAMLMLMLSPRPHVQLQRAAYSLLCKDPMQATAVRVPEDEDSDEDEDEDQLDASTLGVEGSGSEPATVARLQPRLAAALEADSNRLLAAGASSPLRPGYLLAWALLLQRAALCLPESPERLALVTYVRNAELAPTLLTVIFQHLPAALAAPKGIAGIEAAAAVAANSRTASAGSTGEVGADKLPLTANAARDGRVLAAVNAALAWGPALVAHRVLPPETDQAMQSVTTAARVEARDVRDPACGSTGGDGDASAALARDAALARLSAALYALLLRVLPAAARQWFGDLRERGLRTSVEAFTSGYVSPALIEAELETVSASASAGASEGLGGELSIKANRASRLVTASYMQDEATLDMTIALPASYPLLPLEARCERNVGIEKARLRKWLLSIAAYLRNHDGAVVEAVRMWKKNLDAEFDGVEECPICYSVLHATNNALPKMECRTCKHKFHSSCLYKWVHSSGKSTCPLCQSPFAG